MQDNLGIFVIAQLSKPKDDADRRKPEVNYLGGGIIRVIPDSPKARGGQDLSQLSAFCEDVSAFSIYLGLRTVRGIPDYPEPRVNYFGLRAVSMAARDVAHRNFQIRRSSNRILHAEAAFNPMSYRGTSELNALSSELHMQLRCI